MPTKYKQLPLQLYQLNIRYNSFLEESRRRPTFIYQISFSVINIVEMGEENTFFLMFPVKLTLYMVVFATILAEYYVK